MVYSNIFLHLLSLQVYIFFKYQMSLSGDKEYHMYTSTIKCNIFHHFMIATVSIVNLDSTYFKIFYNVVRDQEIDLKTIFWKRKQKASRDHNYINFILDVIKNIIMHAYNLLSIAQANALGVLPK